MHAPEGLMDAVQETRTIDIDFSDARALAYVVDKANMDVIRAQRIYDALRSDTVGEMRLRVHLTLLPE